MKDGFYLGHKWNPKTGRKGRRVMWRLRSHMTLLGPTSCGKGVTIEIPNLLMKGALYHSSVVSIDPTAQNYSVTWRWRSSFSDVVALNPFDLLGTGNDAGFNPLLTVQNYQEAAAIAECLQDMRADAREPFFQDMAALLLTGLILFEIRQAKEEGRTPTLEIVVGLLNGDLPATAQKMVDSGDFQLASIGGRFLQDNRTTQGIIATAAASTRWLLSDEMRRSLSVDRGFDMARLHGPKPVSLFVILDADKLATFGGWLRLVVVSALNTLLTGYGRRRAEYSVHAERVRPAWKNAAGDCRARPGPEIWHSPRAHGATGHGPVVRDLRPARRNNRYRQQRLPVRLHAVTGR